MTLELVKRWNGVSSEQNALLEPSPFGLHEARQDYRGFQWRTASVDERLLRRECPIVCVRGLGLQVLRESVWVCHS